MKDRIKRVTHKLLLKWIETIGNTVTDDGMTLNKYGADNLNKDLNEIWDLLDDVQTLLSEMEKELMKEETLDEES